MAPTDLRLLAVPLHGAQATESLLPPPPPRSSLPRCSTEFLLPLPLPHSSLCQPPLAEPTRQSSTGPYLKFRSHSSGISSSTDYLQLAPLSQSPPSQFRLPPPSPSLSRRHSHLLVLLQSKVDFQHSPLPSDSRAGSFPIRHTNSEFIKPVSTSGLALDDILLSTDDLEMYIDLAPFLNPSPYIVPEDMSLSKAYNLFRQLGLRHLLVIPRPSRVLGVITRQDLLIEDDEDLSTVELQSTSR